MKKTLQLCATLALLASLAACGGGGSSSSSSSNQSWAQTSGSVNVTSLTEIDNTVGLGATAVDGDTLTVNYTGWLYQSGATNSEGQEFDSTSGGTPFSFPLGKGQVIAGWDQGLVGMKVGGTRTLIIPSSLGYGPNGYGPIPGGAALVFTVQLVGVTPPAQ
jgi:FKBP-type peptidyl-prolyl cis-trans isomerase FkpA